MSDWEFFSVDCVHLFNEVHQWMKSGEVMAAGWLRPQRQSQRDVDLAEPSESHDSSH